MSKIGELWSCPLSKPFNKKGEQMLKMLKKVFLLCMIFSLSSCAVAMTVPHQKNMMEVADSHLTSTTDKALVRFFRPGSFGFLIKPRLLDSEKVIATISATSQFDYLVAPGKHLFIAECGGTSYLEADLKAGETYYVLVEMKSGTFQPGVKLSLIVKGSDEWDDIKNYEKDLEKIKPMKSVLLAWETENKDKIRALLDEYRQGKNKK
jgi:hypothetical protein